LELGPAVVLNERDYGAAVDAGSGLSKLIGSRYEPEAGAAIGTYAPEGRRSGSFEERASLTWSQWANVFL